MLDYLLSCLYFFNILIPSRPAFCQFITKSVAFRSGIGKPFGPVNALGWMTFNFSYLKLIDVKVFTVIAAWKLVNKIGGGFLLPMKFLLRLHTVNTLIAFLLLS